MLGRSRSFRVRLLILGSSAAISFLGTTTGSAIGVWQDASSPYATARFGTCDPANSASFSYSVTMATQNGYSISRRQPIGGKCYTLSEWRPHTDATTFRISPDLTSAELRGPTTNFGIINVRWTAKPSQTYDPVSGSGPWVFNPSVPPTGDAGVWVEVGRSATAFGTMPGLVSAAAGSAVIAFGTGGGAWM